jgi:hypothetical protein
MHSAGTDLTSVLDQAPQGEELLERFPQQESCRRSTTNDRAPLLSQSTEGHSVPSMGKRTVKVVPSPSLLLTMMSPLWFLTMP